MLRSAPVEPDPLFAVVDTFSQRCGCAVGTCTRGEAQQRIFVIKRLLNFRLPGADVVLVTP